MQSGWGQRLRLFLNFSSSTGARGEQAAAKYLKRHGYRILARNLRNRYGEIDLLAEAPDGRTIVIVEVKASHRTDGPKSGDELNPEVRVNLAKQHKLTALAGQVIRRYKLEDRPIRFDVVGVVFFSDGQVELRHHPGAFESTI